MGLGVVLHAKRRILGGEPSQRSTELVLISLRSHLDRYRQQRLRNLPRFENDRILLVRQRVPGLSASQLADGHDVPGHGKSDRALGFAQRVGQHPDALVFIVVVVTGEFGIEGLEVSRDVHACVGAQRAGENPHQRNTADVAITGGLDDFGYQRTRRVTGDGAGRLAHRREHLRAGVLQRGGESGNHQIEQLRCAQPRCGVEGDHREERGPRNCSLQIGGQQLCIDFLPAT